MALDNRCTTAATGLDQGYFGRCRVVKLAVLGRTVSAWACGARRTGSSTIVEVHTDVSASSGSLQCYYDENMGRSQLTLPA